MPLTDFQRQIFAVVKSIRNEHSHVAGGTLLNRDSDSPRFSADIDIFHDLQEAVASSAMQDSVALREAGFIVEWILQQPMFYRATVTRGADSIKLEWVFDSAFRFFPIIPDPDFGFALHRFDAATNKVLAAANRNEVRDLIDLVRLHETWVSLGQLVWAACGKDPGLSPDFIFDNIRRNSCVRPEKLELELLTEKLTPRELKGRLLAALDEAQKLVATLPATELGACYVDAAGEVVRISDASSNIRTHFGSIGGAWPRECEV